MQPGATALQLKDIVLYGSRLVRGEMEIVEGVQQAKTGTSYTITDCRD